MFGKSSPKSELHANIIRLANDTSILGDGSTVQFNSKYSADAYDFDAMKLWNFSENIALVRNDKTLALELPPVPKINDTIFYRLYLFQSTEYKFQVYSQNLPVNMKNAKLVDKYLNTQTNLNPDDTLLYDFVTNTDTNSYRNRFMIVFTPSASKNISANNVANKNISDNSTISVYPNPVTANKMQLHFENVDKGTYDIFIYDIKGQKLLDKKIEHNGDSNIYTVSTNSSGHKAHTCLAQ